MDEKILLTFYGFAHKNQGFGKAAKNLAKLSSPLFFMIYTIGAVYLLINAMYTTAAFYICVPAANLAVTLLIRSIVRRPRPYAQFGGGFPVKSSYSFPSNHSSSAAIIAFACMFISYPLGAAVFMLSISTGLSRIFIGVHYPSDVALGFLLSGTAAIIGFNIIPQLLYSI